jgi:tetratricopeptide (TPR) repeat protein
MSKIVKGENHPDTVAAIFEVASTFTDMGLQDQAIPLLEFCIETNMRLLGFEHKKTQDVFYDLIFCLMDKGLFQQALPKAEVHRDIQRDIYLQKIGPDHPDTIGAVNMIAQCLQDLDRYDEALPLYRECLQKTREQHGDEHPDSLSYANNLASAYQDKELFDHALPIHVAVLESCKRVHGDHHPETYIMMHNLAGDAALDAMLCSHLTIASMQIVIFRKET